MADWFVYMVRCADNTLYTGITTNVERRIAEHNGDKRGAKYTRIRQPVTLAYQQSCQSRSEASKLEYQLKQLSRQQKLKKIQDWSA